MTSASKGGEGGHTKKVDKRKSGCVIVRVPGGGRGRGGGQNPKTLQTSYLYSPQLQSGVAGPDKHI